MRRIAPDSLMTLEAYARVRQEFRARMIVHKKSRITMRLFYVSKKKLTTAFVLA